MIQQEEAFVKVVCVFLVEELLTISRHTSQRLITFKKDPLYREGCLVFNPAFFFELDIARASLNSDCHPLEAL